MGLRCIGFFGWGTARKIEIAYDAAGRKLSRTVYTGTNIDYKQDYIGGVEYRTVGATRKLESILHAEGRRYNTNVNTASTTEGMRIEYSIRDHLGNTRLTFCDKNNNGKIDVTNTSSNEILSENHYYPFGLSYGGNLWMNEVGDVDNRYLYNGKEFNGDHGLNWLDYGARWYDPVIGRWNAVDPLAEKHFDFTPYNYVLSNPLLFIDPLGLDTIKPQNKPNEPVHLILEDGTPATVVVRFDRAVENYGTIEPFEPLPSLGLEYSPLISTTAGALGGIVDPSGGIISDVAKAIETIDVVKSAGVALGAAGIKLIKTGAYEILFESGKTYVGKGSKRRMKLSAKRIELIYGDKPVSKMHFSTKTSKDGFILEHELMMKNGGPRSAGNMNTYNRIHSPGRKYAKKNKN